MGIVEEQLVIPAEHEKNVFGQFDQFIKKIEKTYHVTTVSRDGSFRILGAEHNVKKAAASIRELVELSRRGNTITEQNVNYLIAMDIKEGDQTLVQLDSDLICHTINGRPVKPKTLGQKDYIDAIRNNMITFGVGPAGTGKTYLAMAMAITAFRNDEVSRIILTRPAIEAGEKLGFLPGDLQSKVDPYLRPLYDALYQIMGADAFQKNMEKGLIEVAPLAYMRGRTLDNAYIILDEAQNTTPAQMKMFLTRIGFGSKVVVTGDASQKDLAPGIQSGLDVAMRILKKVEGIAICQLTSRDVVRHPLVQRIVEAYERYENKEEARRPENRRGNHDVRSGRRESRESSETRDSRRDNQSRHGKREETRTGSGSDRSTRWGKDS
ncbi:MAG: PhoH family protein [Lachnospiraceae bacterium]|nr:PhoH family protein [Lachnospiraceae bacterium]